jgi:hypothetical protein
LRKSQKCRRNPEVVVEVCNLSNSSGIHRGIMSSRPAQKKIVQDPVSKVRKSKQKCWEHGLNDRVLANCVKTPVFISSITK